MALEPVAEYEFVCAACREEITVNEEMKTALMDHGCVICGELPSEDAFTPL